MSLDKFAYVLIHVGTNYVARKASFDGIISDYSNLVGICRKVKPSIKILISAILPRPVIMKVLIKL